MINLIKSLLHSEIHMRLFVYIICLLSCLQSTLLNCASLTQILDLDEEITATEALDYYKRYEPELRGKSPNELNDLLTDCLHHPDFFDPLHQQKTIALLMSGARQLDPCLQTPLYNAIFYNNIPFARFVCTYYPEDPNRVFWSNPLWFYCTSTAMAKLLFQHGANVEAQFNRNILHYICADNERYTYNNLVCVPPSEKPVYIKLLATKCPALLNQLDNQGNTPLLTWITNPSSIDYAYTLLSLGADPTIVPTKGRYAGKTMYELIQAKANNEEYINTEQAKEFLALAQHIKNISSIPGPLMEPVADKPDLETGLRTKYTKRRAKKRYTSLL